MARPDDIRVFNSASYSASVRGMHERGEDVHYTGREYREKTGSLHPNVDIANKIPRGSHNAMIPGDKPGTFILPNGISMPMLNLFDGTGSTAQWVGEFFKTAERQYMLLEGVRPRYNPQLSTGVVQDVYNVRHDGLPVVQVAQFEGDERSAEHVRLLQPASMGNNTSAEDYDLGLYYATLIYADFWTFYGLKGHMTLALDEIGRGFVNGEDVRTFLGQSADFSRVTTSEICQQLLEHWHFFILQVPTGYQNHMLPRTKEWWKDYVGKSRIIQVENPSLMAEVRAALVYAVEAINPTLDGLTKFLVRDGVMIDAANLDKVWRMIQPAEEHFGEQQKVPGYQDIPRAGDVFAHFRHAWPIGHARFSENVTPVEAAAL